MMEPETARWLVLTWRLPSGSSTPRVALWRSLLGIASAAGDIQPFVTEASR